MLSKPDRQEIDHRTIKLIIGVIALSLATLTSYFAGVSITSISASYYEEGWSRSIFIGFLFAISALLLAYNGFTKTEMVMSKVAAIAALGVALFPCACDSHQEIIPHLHSGSAAAMFIVLTFFCYRFYLRAINKGYIEAKLRAYIYAASGLVIVIAIAAMTYDNVTGNTLSEKIPRFTFYGERAGLVAFGVSWLTASKVFPLLTKKEERHSPFS